MENKFIRIADLPPDPTDAQALTHYRDMGMNVCLLTEDNVALVRDGKVNPEYLQAMDNIHRQGMQVWIRNMFNDPDYFDCPDTDGSNYGSPYHMDERHITTELSGAEGFYMADEAYMYQLPENINISWIRPDCPQYASFDRLTRLADWKNQNAPNAFFHMNHVPANSWDHYMPRNGQVYSYEDFLTEYANTILRRVKGCGRSLCLDNYPLIGEDYLEFDYLRDLMIAAKVTRDYNATVPDSEKAIFGICLQTFRCKDIFACYGHVRERDIVCPEEITLQMYCGMALGARLFEYFAYRSYLHELYGIIDPDGNDRLYDIVKEANRRADFYEPLLCRYQSIGGYIVPGTKESHNTRAIIQAHEYFCQPLELEVSGEYDTLVGCLLGEKQPAYLLVNYTDPSRKCISTVTVQGNVQTLTVWQDGRKTQLSSPDGCFRLTLGTGGCALVTWG